VGPDPSWPPYNGQSWILPGAGEPKISELDSKIALSKYEPQITNTQHHQILSAMSELNNFV